MYECTVTVGLFVFQLMPSSPRYLIIKGKRKQALRNINIVARINCKSKFHIKLVTDEEKAEMMSERHTDRPSINDENDKVMDSLPNPVNNSSKSHLLVHKRTPKLKVSVRAERTLAVHLSCSISTISVECYFK